MISPARRIATAVAVLLLVSLLVVAIGRTEALQRRDHERLGPLVGRVRQLEQTLREHNVPIPAPLPVPGPPGPPGPRGRPGAPATPLAPSTGSSSPPVGPTLTPRPTPCLLPACLP